MGNNTWELLHLFQCGKKVITRVVINLYRGLEPGSVGTCSGISCCLEEGEFCQTTSTTYFTKTINNFQIS